MHRGRARHWLVYGAAGLVAGWLLLAYLVLPLLWRADEDRHHAALDSAPVVTRNADGIPGDPVNVGLVGSEPELAGAMLAIGWQPADPITLRSSLGIAESVLLDRPDPDAPVSALFLFGRKQDLAFEREAGDSADRRHHVRWWRTPTVADEARPLWLGAVTFDRGSGLSHRTGQITHHIAPEVDAERDALIGELTKAGRLERTYDWPGIGATTSGRNAGGDRYVTDGRMRIGVLEPSGPGG